MEPNFLHPAWHLVPMDQPGAQIASTIALLEETLEAPFATRRVQMRVWTYGMAPVLITSDN